MFWFSALCIADNGGMEVSAAWLITAFFTSIVLGVATPPVPGGMVATYAILFTQLGLPKENLAIIMSLSVLLDYLLTATKVFSNQCLMMLVPKDM